mmetsp:Transcript_72774/g.189429  ORF Transcript_72774/g.189429 Transcript_72774/m.189429 type:complete len:237 (+) Transcript_72774:525-1235(+)
MVLLQRSSSNSPCSPAPSFCPSFCLSSSEVCRSSAICRSSAAMADRTLSPLASLVRLVSENFCWSSSRACSVSCEFWIKNKFDSSFDVNTSNSCFGSLKYKSISSPEDTSVISASISSRFLYFFLIFLLLASISRSRSFCSSSASRLCRRRLLAASAAFSSMSRSSASISACILALSAASLASTLSCFLLSLRPSFSCCMASFHSWGVNFSKKCLYLKHSSFCSLCFAISLCRALS